MELEKSDDMFFMLITPFIQSFTAHRGHVTVNCQMSEDFKPNFDFINSYFKDWSYNGALHQFEGVFRDNTFANKMYELWTKFLTTCNVNIGMYGTDAYMWEFNIQGSNTVYRI